MHISFLKLIVATVVAMIMAMPFVHAASLSPDKPITIVGSEIEVVLDIRKKEVRIDRFSIDTNIPTGMLQHDLTKPYIVRLKTAPKIKVDGLTIFTASDLFDGIGLELKIELYVPKTGEASGTVNITSQMEETMLSYSAQLLKVQQ